MSPTEYSPSGFFFFPLSLSLSAGFRFDKERCTCEKDTLNLSFPVRKAGGSDFKTVAPTYPPFFFFFFFSSFVFNDFSLTTLRTNYHLPYPGHVVALHVYTDISSEHSLRTCTQVQRNVRKSNVVYATKKKKNATVKNVTVRVWHLTFIARAPPICSPFVLAKGIVSQVHRFFFFFL